MPTPHSLSDKGVRSRQQYDVDELRNRALARLYSRRAVVDDLIRSLENYERVPLRLQRAQCVPIRKWS